MKSILLIHYTLSIIFFNPFIFFSSIYESFSSYYSLSIINNSSFYFIYYFISPLFYSLLLLFSNSFLSFPIYNGYYYYNLSSLLYSIWLFPNNPPLYYSGLLSVLPNNELAYSCFYGWSVYLLTGTPNNGAVTINWLGLSWSLLLINVFDANKP